MPSLAASAAVSGVKLLGLEEPEPLTAIRGDGTGKQGDQTELPMGLLGELVELFNERFGAELSDADAVPPLQQIVEKVAEDPDLRDQALANDFDEFERGKEAASSAPRSRSRTSTT